MEYEQKIRELGLVLPAAPAPAGAYRPAVVIGEMAVISGQISRDHAGRVVTGTAGRDLTVEEAKEAARHAARAVLGVLKDCIGFENVERLIRVAGYVQAAEDFCQVSEVMNAASQIFLDVFGEAGAHVRVSVGASVLPLRAAVEIEVSVKIKPAQARTGSQP